MKPSQTAYKFIENEEGLRLKSYQDKGGKWTIGWGNTKYKSGKNVGPGETITKEQADELIQWEIDTKSAMLNGLLWNAVVNQNQFDSLVSICYNIGMGNFSKSTLLKTIRLNPHDPYIKDCFNMWVKVRNEKTGKLEVDPVLVARRKREYKLYTS